MKSDLMASCKKFKLDEGSFQEFWTTDFEFVSRDDQAMSVSAPINNRLNVVERSPTPSKWLLAFPRVPGTRGTPLYISAMLPPEQQQKGSSQLLQNWSPVFSFFFSCPSLSLLRLLILLLLLMSGNVHPNPGSIFPCSVCAGNVTWRGKSVQCCARNGSI